MLDRRQFLCGVSAAAGLSVAGALTKSAFGTPGIAGTTPINKVIVIGAGIVGASIAWNLSKRGCEVVVVDKQTPASQASGNSFAWINASWFDQPNSYLMLRTHSLNEWHRLEQEIDLPIRWGGSLEWYADPAAEQEMSDGVARTQLSGIPSWIVDGNRAMQIEANLRVDEDQRITWTSRDGAVDPAGATRAILREFESTGGQVIYPAKVTAIDEGSGVVTTDVDTFTADLVVCATGVGTSEIADLLELPDPMRQSTPGIIVTTEPMDRIVETVVYNHETHFHQLPDGRLLVGEKRGAPQTSEHQALLGGRPNKYPGDELAAEHVERVFDVATRYLPQLANAKAESVGVGWRPLPKDGLPIVGHLNERPDVYMAAMHSGITLAPIVGHLAAMEILDGVRVNLLDDFRYERFQ